MILYVFTDDKIFIQRYTAVTYALQNLSSILVHDLVPIFVNMTLPQYPLFQPFEALKQMRLYLWLTMFRFRVQRFQIERI